MISDAEICMSSMKDYINKQIKDKKRHYISTQTQLVKDLDLDTIRLYKNDYNQNLNKINLNNI